MSISPRFYWTFSGEVFVKDLPGMPNTVAYIEAQYHATVDNLDVAHGVVVDLAAPVDNFANFDSLTREQVITWLDANVPADELSARRYLLTLDLENLMKPQVWERGMQKRLIPEHTPPAPPAQG